MGKSENFSKDSNPLRVTLLGSGTSTGVPVIGCRCAVCTSTDARNKRLRASLLLESAATRLIIDTGPDFRQQILSVGSPLIDAVLYTHLHADHVHGFDDLRGLSFQTGKPVRCYLAQDLHAELKERFAYAFMETGYIGAKPKIDLMTMPDDGFFKVKDLEIETTRVPHGHVMTSVFKIGNFAYATDFKTFPPELIGRWRGKIQTLVASGIYFGTHESHSTIDETLALFDALAVKRGIITHISHRVDHEEVSRRLPQGTELGYDNLIFEVF